MEKNCHGWITNDGLLYILGTSYFILFMQNTLISWLSYVHGSFDSECMHDALSIWRRFWQLVSKYLKSSSCIHSHVQNRWKLKNWILFCLTKNALFLHEAAQSYASTDRRRTTETSTGNISISGNESVGRSSVRGGLTDLPLIFLSEFDLNSFTSISSNFTWTCLQ